MQPETGSGGRLSVSRRPEGIHTRQGVARRLIQPADRAFPAQGFPVEGRSPLAEDPAVNQHSPGRGGDEPAPVQSRLRLTGPQEPPHVPAQDLHPSVVVVTVGPAGGVDLPGGDAHAAQSGDQEGGLLPAAAAPAAKNGERGGGALILGLIAGVFMAPAVDLQSPFLLTGEVLDPGPESGAEDFPVKGQVLVVYPREENVVVKNILLQLPAPRRRLPQGQGVIREAEEQLRRIAVQIAQRQMVPQKFHGPAPVRSQLCQQLLPPGSVSRLHVQLHFGTSPGSRRTSSTVSAGSGSTGLGPSSAKTISG